MTCPLYMDRDQWYRIAESLLTVKAFLMYSQNSWSYYETEKFRENMSQNVQPFESGERLHVSTLIVLIIR